MRIFDFDSPKDAPRRIGTSKRKKWPFILIPIITVVTLGGILSSRSQEQGIEQPPPSAQERDVVLAPDSTATVDTTSLIDPEFILINGKIGRQESFWDALNREGLNRGQVFELVSSLKKGVRRAEFNPNIVQKGDSYKIEIDSLNVIRNFEFVKKGSIETIFMTRRENGTLRSWKEDLPLDRQVVVVSGEIRDMLWNALIKTGENPAILSSKLTDIFEYYVDFMVDCRVGDQFSLVVEKFFKDDYLVRYGEILSAEYQSSRKSYQAFLYEMPDGDAAYYDSAGKSLRGLFLKSPLNYRRISSGYSSRRFHPILKKRIPHHGIDYAASYNTPVWATAGGKVIFRGRKGALGNYVEIRHKNGYKTGYGHLSKFNSKAKTGSYVAQKQIIGYVGATGRATGPHLHYNFFAQKGKDYRLVNPARILHRPTGKPVPATSRPDFTQKRDRLWALLDQDSGYVGTASLSPEFDAPRPPYLTGVTR
jgi:murein DD-endopeptidase MepM/ murein hydrolase activator NlpD